jgi:hypothetical protein
VISESEHDGRVIAIAALFVRFLFDFFKPRQRLEAEILVLRHQHNILQSRTAAKADTGAAQSAAAKCAIWSACAFTKDGRAAARAT